MRFVFLSHTAANDIFRVGSHHYARELTIAGHQVLRVSPPSNPWRRLLKEPKSSASSEVVTSRSWTDADGVHHLDFDTALPLSRGPAQLQNLIGRRASRRVARAMPWDGPPTAYLVDEPHFIHLMRHLPRATVVYRPTDVQSHPRTMTAEIAMAAYTDRVIVTSQYLLDALPPGFKHLPSLILPNGVDFERFASAARSHARSPRVVYVGALDDRYGAETVRAMASLSPGVPFDIYGPNPPRSSLDPSNLTYLDSVNYDLVPQILANATVGILPLSHAPHNAARSPMKLFEYLAAGLNVVSRRIPSLRELEIPGVYFYNHDSDAPELIRTALDQGPNGAGQAAAAAQAWANKADTLAKFAGGYLT